MNVRRMTADSTAPDCGAPTRHLRSNLPVTNIFSPYDDEERRHPSITTLEEDSDTDDDDKSCRTDTDSKSSNSRPSNHSAIEKRRRDQINDYISQISALVPMCAAMPRKLDKLTVLRLAVQHMKTLRGSAQSCGDESYKPHCLTEDELKLVIEEAAQGFVLVLSCDRGKILHCSHSVNQLLGFTAQELAAKSCFDLLLKDDVHILKEQMINAPANDNQEQPESVTSSTSLTVGLNCFCSGAKRRFYCRMKVANNQDQQSEAKPKCSKRKYLRVRCSGYLKSWPPPLSNVTQTDLPSTSSESDTTPSFACLVLAVVPVEAEFVKPSEFALKLGLDGRVLHCDTVVCDALGFLPQELLHRSYYDFIHESDLMAVAEIHKKALEAETGLWVGGTEPYHLKHKACKFVSVVVRWRCFRNPFTNEQEFLTVQHNTLPVNMNDNDSKSGQSQSSEPQKHSSTLMQLLSKLPNEPVSSGAPSRVGAGKIGRFIQDTRGVPGVAPNIAGTKQTDGKSLVDQQLDHNLNGDQPRTGTQSSDQTAMSVLMNLLEPEGGLGSHVDFGEIPWPL